MLKRTGKPVARVMPDIPDSGLSHDDVHEVIESHVTDKVGWRLPGQSEDFFDHLAHEGLLQEVDNERYACPIPTLRRFQILRGGISLSRRPPFGEPGPLFRRSRRIRGRNRRTKP